MADDDVNVPAQSSQSSAPWKVAATAFLWIVAGGLLQLVIVWSPPRSNWYYPTLLGIAFLLGALVYRRDKKLTSTLPPTIAPEREAVKGATIAGVIATAMLIILYIFLKDDPRMLQIAVLMGLMTAVMVYRARWGLPVSVNVMAFVGVGFAISYGLTESALRLISR